MTFKFQIFKVFGAGPTPLHPALCSHGEFHPAHHATDAADAADVLGDSGSAGGKSLDDDEAGREVWLRGQHGNRTIPHDLPFLLRGRIYIYR